MIVMIFVVYHKVSYNQSKEDNIITVDTVYVHNNFQPSNGFKLIQVPHLVMFYSDEIVRIDTVYVDSAKVNYILPEGRIEFNHQFLLNHRDSQKLIELSTSNNSLQLTQLDKNGLIHTDHFKFNPEVNYYHYRNGTLTYHKKPFLQNLEFGAEVMVRPLANMYDFNFGIVYKTSKIIYEIGFNSYFYPIQNSPLGCTPYLKVGIKF